RGDRALRVVVHSGQLRREQSPGPRVDRARARERADGYRHAGSLIENAKGEQRPRVAEDARSRASGRLPPLLALRAVEQTGEIDPLDRGRAPAKRRRFSIGRDELEAQRVVARNELLDTRLYCRPAG